MSRSCSANFFALLALLYSSAVRLLTHRLAPMAAQLVVPPLVQVLSLGQGLGRLESLPLVALAVRHRAQAFCLELVMGHRVLVLAAKADRPQVKA